MTSLPGMAEACAFLMCCMLIGFSMLREDAILILLLRLINGWCVASWYVSIPPPAYNLTYVSEGFFKVLVTVGILNSMRSHIGLFLKQLRSGAVFECTVLKTEAHWALHWQSPEREQSFQGWQCACPGTLVSGNRWARAKVRDYTPEKLCTNSLLHVFIHSRK